MTSNLAYEEFWNNLNSIDNISLQSSKEFLRAENRSSTIFPVFKNSSITTSIQFLSYWLKKHGNNVIICLTSRSIDGEQLEKKYKIITEYKSYQLQISDYFSDLKNGFCGSVEVEVYSKNKPFYTFPAITVYYEGNGSSSLVHSGIRTYNKDEAVSDYAIMYPQTGFNTHLSNQTKNFICFFGGDSSVYNLCIEIFEGSFSRSYDLEITNNSYGQMHVIWLEDLIDASDIEFLKNPKCSIHHDLQDVFPRFYVGILKENCPPSLTHTFFDTSKAEELPNDNMLSLRACNQDHHCYFDSAFIVPIFPTDSFDTALQTYGQNLSFSGDAHLTIYTMQGEDIYSRSLSQAEIFNLSGFDNFHLSELLNSLNVQTDQYYCVKLAFVSKETPFPMRFKLGLNVKRKTEEIGTNICFAPLVVTENTFTKPFNRRWFPVGGSRNYLATVHNTSLEVAELSANTECDFEFVNHRGETLVKHVNVKSNGSVLLDVTQDNELNDFLGKRGGWCMVTSKSYLTDAYYFSLMDKQIGGDHAY